MKTYKQALIFLLILSYISCSVYKNEFTTTIFDAAPDGIMRKVIGVNNQIPGPTIRIQKGDFINVTLNNQLSDKQGTSIHWHGILQKGTNNMDGQAGVTQCSTLFNQKLQYYFSTGDQTGTYWWHSHNVTQYADGLKGALIIDDPNEPFMQPFNTYISKHFTKNKYGAKVNNTVHYVNHSKVEFDGSPDSVIQLSDWNHQLSGTYVGWFLSPISMGNEPTPNSSLINGVGQYNCTTDCKYYNTKLIQGKAKRIRIINTSSMGVFNFQIEGHLLTIIETDGIPVKPVTVSQLRINVGQRYSVIVKGNSKKNQKNYWIRATLNPNIYPSKPNPKWQPDVKGILWYCDNKGNLLDKNFPSIQQFKSMKSKILDSFKQGNLYIDPRIKLVPSNSPKPPKKATRVVNLSIIPVTDDNGINHLSFNNIVFTHPMKTSVLGQVLNKTAKQTFKITKDDGLKYALHYEVIYVGETIDIVFNNTDGGQHPLHLHGHHFYIMYVGPSNNNTFNYSEFAKTYNEDASRRDTVSINPNSIVVIRFPVDNPGAWMMHCHIDWHMLGGLAFVWIEAPNRIRNIYENNIDDLLTCKHTHVL